MSVIAEKFPNASAHLLSDYDIKNVVLNYTDMMTYADIENMGVFEKAPFLISKYTPLSPYDKAKKEEAYIWNFTNKFFDDKISTTEISDSSMLVEAPSAAASHLYYRVYYPFGHVVFLGIFCDRLAHSFAVTEREYVSLVFRYKAVNALCACK